MLLELITSLGLHAVPVVWSIGETEGDAGIFLDNAWHRDHQNRVDGPPFLGGKVHRVQAVRNLDDLECLACPPKYREIKTFYKYYSGEEVAPYPTIFSEFPPTC
jgi:hypothetical protein